MKIFVTILIGTILIGCGPQNNDFDPFDNEYRFHKTFRQSDYDTINGECGYWNLTNRDDGTYYQFFLDESEIVAKGFNLIIDEIQVSNLNNDSINRLFESIENKTIDINLIQERLKQFKIKQVTFLPDSTLINRLELIDENDSTYYADVLPFYENNKIFRQISYFNGKGN
jgi:hypothetical protein